MAPRGASTTRRGRNVIKVNALVLAAGAASRFGIPKPLLPAGARHTLLSRVLELALGAVSGEVRVVLGREAALAEHHLKGWLKPRQDRVRLVRNSEYARGLSSSLKAGLETLGQDTPVLVLLADQPALTPERLADLISTYHYANHSANHEGRVLAVAAAVGGEQRTPVVLGPELLAEVRALTGDSGARKVLARHAARLRLLEWREGLWSTDVDSWQDYQRLALALDWQGDPTPSLPQARALPPGLVEAARQALALKPAPYLKADTLLIAYPCTAAVYGLPAGTLDHPDAVALNAVALNAVAAGKAEHQEDYLHLLRRAALTLLRQAKADGRG